MPLPTQPTIPLFQAIINAACQYYEVSEADLKTREHVEKKKIVQYLLRTEADLKFLQITRIFSETNSSHSRAWEHVSEIDARKNISRSIRTDIENIKKLSGICE